MQNLQINSRWIWDTLMDTAKIGSTRKPDPSERDKQNARGCWNACDSPSKARSFHALDNVSQRLPVQIDTEALQRHVVQFAADRFEAFLAYKAHEAAPQCQKLR
jgi:hypothetical protein